MHAEPAIDENGNFLPKLISFRFVEKKKGNDEVREIFKRTQAKNFELSLLDNRIGKL